MDSPAGGRHRQDLSLREAAGEHAGRRNYNVVRPDYQANWQIRAQAQFMFPKRHGAQAFIIRMG